MLSKSNYYKLTPTKYSDIDTYEEALDYVFQDHDVKNIAITGSYSSGKSSVLETYKNKHKEKSFIHISLADFDSFNYSSNGEGTVLCDENKLEGMVLNQLIHQVDSDKIPQTHFKIKRNVTVHNLIKEIVPLIITTFSIIYLMFYSKIKGFIELFRDDTNKFFLDFILSDIAKIVILMTSIIVFGAFLFNIYILQKDKKLFKKISHNGNEIEIFQDSEESYFDKYLNEVLYVFQNSCVDAIVFEDIDRYKNNSIFKKLREINYLINNKSYGIDHKNKCSLRFLYLIRDDMFESKDRTKFFDFIIPIVPIIDGSNTLDQMIKLLRNRHLLNRFSDQFMHGISLYIDDMRLLKNIINEYVVYSNKIKNIELNQEKLLSLMVYKNIFPRDFSSLQLSHGYLFELLNGGGKLIDIHIKSIDKSIEEFKMRIERIKAESIKTIDELDAMYLLANDQDYSITWNRNLSFETNDEKVRKMKDNPEMFYVNGSRYGVTVKELLDNLDENEKYVQRKKNIIDSFNNKVNDLLKLIKKYEAKKSGFKSRKLKKLITKENIDSYFKCNITNDFKEIEKSKYFPLIKYLIRNGYIDESYNDYIALFHAESIRHEDKVFLRSLTDEKILNPTFDLKKPEKIINRLSNDDFQKEEILNFTLLDWLICNDNNKLNNFFELLVNASRFKFIREYIDRDKNVELFIDKITNKFPNLVYVLMNNNTWDEYMKRKYLILVISYCDKKMLKILNKEGELSYIIRNNMDFINQDLMEDMDVEKIVNVLKMWNVKFKSINILNANTNLLDEIYYNNLYDINIEMIELFMHREFSNHQNLDNKTMRTSIIFEYPDSMLYKYISSNISNYMQIHLESIDEVNDYYEVVMRIINNDSIDVKIKREYIRKLNVNVNKLNDITDKDIWNTLVMEIKICPNAENIIQYFIFSDCQLNDELINLINQKEYDGDYCFSNSFEEGEVSKLFDYIIACEKININSYRSLIKGFDFSCSNFNIYNMSLDYLSVLIELKKINMNISNLSIVREHYNEIIKEFINSDIYNYCEILDNETIVVSELEWILTNSSVNYRKKINLIGLTEEKIRIDFKGYSNKIIEHIVENNFDIRDLKYLLMSWSSQSDKIKRFAIEYLESNINIFKLENMDIDLECVDYLVKEKPVREETILIVFASIVKKIDIQKILYYLTMMDMKNMIRAINGGQPEIVFSEGLYDLTKQLEVKGVISSYKIKTDLTPKKIKLYGKRRKSIRS